MAEESRKSVIAALIGNILVAITKFVAAAITGSSAILSEGVHSLVDTGNELLLMHGMRRAARPPDEHHPLGYGRELYFWSFIVALLVFALGAGVSFYEGVHHIQNPEPIRHASANYIVLGLSILFEGYSWFIARRAFASHKGQLSYLAAVRRSKDPTTFTVLFEDTAALIGIVFAFLGVFASEVFGRPWLDGVASLGIAGLLATTAAFLARETKGLLLGEPARPAVEKHIADMAARHPGIAKVNGLWSVHLGPDQIVVALSVELDDHMAVREIESQVMRLRRAVKREIPEVQEFLVTPEHLRRGPAQDMSP